MPRKRGRGGRGGGGRRAVNQRSTNGGASPHRGGVKQQHEKQWHESVRSEADLDLSHITKLYHLDLAPCTAESHGPLNCEDNPSCLQKLGEDGAGVWATHPPSIEALGEDLNEHIRQADTPAGLENLGATCYMNNVLQCLFMNTAFRQGVYALGTSSDEEGEEEEAVDRSGKQASTKYRVDKDLVRDDDDEMNISGDELEQEEGEEKQTAQLDQRGDVRNHPTDETPHEDTVCMELQRLFVLLQEGSRKFYNPKDLTRALNLKTSIQQDAQEFNKLFIDYLEERFERSSNVIVKDLMRQFKGEYAYTTICQACKTVSQRKCLFSELELNLKECPTIYESLERFLAEEQLTDSNRYFCENCNMLQDATRSIVLLDLPKVLNLQLMRFVYDIDTNLKRKLQDSIAFPFDLDMGKFLLEFDERRNNFESKRRRKGLVYELVGVLIHVGAGANVGHYIAHIKDDITKKWWRFDDADVTPIAESKVGKEKEPKKARKKAAAQLGEGMAASSNAYMLIYALKDRPTVAQPQPPATMLKLAQQDNAEFERRRDEYNQLVQEERGRIELHKQTYNINMPSFFVKPDDAEYNWISVSWLRDWVTGNKDLTAIDNTNLLCPHEMLDPRKIHQAKRISQEAWKMLESQFQGGPILSQDCYCITCATVMCQEMARDVEFTRMKESTVSLINSANSTTPTKGFILSTAWFNQWKKKTIPEDLSHDMNANITCEHGNLSPSGGRKVIPVKAWSWLRSMYSEGSEFPSSTNVCSICVEENETNKVEIKQLRERKAQEKKEVSAVLNQNDITEGHSSYYLISQAWFERWQAFVDNVADDQEPDPITNRDLICTHGLLHIPISSAQFPINNADTEFRMSTSGQWKKLLARYDVDQAIRLHSEKKQGQCMVLNTDPPTCTECTELRESQKIEHMFNYEEADITVTTKRRPIEGRTRRSKGAKTELITVSSEDTILVVKLKILEKLEIEPNEQALFFGSLELKDPRATLRDYHVPAKATIHIERRQMSIDDYDILDGHDQAEEGFKGTIFTSREPKPKQQQQQQQQQQPQDSTTLPSCDDENMLIAPSPAEEEHGDEENQWACATCTFVNRANRSPVCEMCGSDRAQC